MIAALKTSPDVKVVEGAVDALEGALWRAREAGQSTYDGPIERTS
jgi:glucosamine kinase